MAIIHIVMFEPKEGIEQSTVDGMCNDMRALSTKCVHPDTKKPYIKNMSGGKNNSPEAVKVSYTYGFVVEFEKEDDRKYYLEQDPAHAAFVKSLDGLVNGVGVFDYEPGAF